MSESEKERFGQATAKDLRDYREQVRPEMQAIAAREKACAFCGEPATLVTRRDGGPYRSVCADCEADGSRASGLTASRRRLEAIAGQA